MNVPNAVPKQSVILSRSFKTISFILIVGNKKNGLCNYSVFYLTHLHNFLKCRPPPKHSVLNPHMEDKQAKPQCTN